MLLGFTTFSWFKNGIVLSGQTGNSNTVNIDGLGNYTLRIANSTGCEGTSNTVVVSGANSNKLFVYPSPSTGKFQVRYFTDVNNLQPLKMAIYNSAGALIFNGQYTIFCNYMPMGVDLTKHGHGVYHIHLLNVNGETFATKTIIVHK